MSRETKRNLLLSKIKDSLVYQLVLCIILCLFVIVGFLIINNLIDKRKFKEYKIVKDINLINSIENIIVDNKNVILNGYAFMLNSDTSDNIISLFIRSMDTEKEIWFDTEQVNRPDVKEYFGGENNYYSSGFIASQDLKSLNQDEIYEIIINLDCIESNNKHGSKKTRKTVSTNRYLLNNELYDYNPEEFNMPDIDIESELLREVFSNGHLCFYNKEEGIYMYQYNNKLYYITMDNFKYNDGKTLIPYHLYTTNISKLPKERIQHKFNNPDFIFEQNEFKDEITAPYRVVIRNIPQEYPVAYITTGVYDEENNQWIWTESFHLDNLMSND